MKPNIDADLETLQRESFSYFVHETNPANGLVIDKTAPDEREIRTLADLLYRRVNWHWAQNQGATLTHGWKPESGFLKSRWEGYDEALLLYMLALGSPTYALSDNSYAAWCSTYKWQRSYGYDRLKTENRYGFKATFNATHPDRSNSPFGWVSPWQSGLNQGPVTLMAENYRSGLLWQLMRNCPYLVSGLRRAGFTGGWL